MNGRPKHDLMYLSSPYSHADHRLRHLRYRACMLTVAHYLHKGIYLYSPIMHNHPIVCHDDLGTAEEWLTFDYAVLDRCTEMWVLMIPGWDRSSGIQHEIAHCDVEGINVVHIKPPFDLGTLHRVSDFGGPNGRR